MKPSNTVIVSTDFIKEHNELVAKCNELEKKLTKAEDAIREAYWKCENCYKGVCQYCLNSGVRCYMQGNNVESVGKLKEKLDITIKTLEKYADHSMWKQEFDEEGTLTWCASSFLEYDDGWRFAQEALKQIKDVK